MSATNIEGRCALTGRLLSLMLADGLVREVHELDSTALTNSWLSPGFIDLQVNGYGGCDLNEPDVSEDTVLRLAHRLLAQGTTIFLPTVITANEDHLLHALETIARARDRDSQLAQAIPGIHLEGPNISPEDGARGAHPAEHVRPPDVGEFMRWQRAGRGLVCLVTLSPHWSGASDYIATLVAQGIRVAIGHTHANPQQIAAAVDAGATLSTHLGNGIASSLPRHPNPIWTQLANDRLRATFIADGHHLPADTLKVMLRAKGINRSILVSDSVALAGMPPGIYDTAIGGRVQLDGEGRLSTADTHLLAGATLPLKDNVTWLVRQGLCSLSEAIRMASVHPGTFLDLPKPYTVGAPANVIQFSMKEGSNALHITTAVRGGCIWHEGDA